ncbi:MAG: bifunctional diguanylate cyclase/phosphodiesterase [Candidatus Dormibacteraeota bacterium]|nr:bifunctional diguanylate cyclase/phosphodiesterase [Candidatus Dormibacteraeota bacterium]
MLIKQDGGRVLPGSWLDGAVAGFGVAALFATFLFGSIENSLGDTPAQLATNLAYPVGDLILLGLAVGGSAVLSGSTTLTWRVLAVACAINAVGDTFNLINATQASAVGLILDGVAWPTSILLISMSVWAQPRSKPVINRVQTTGFVLPGLGALLGLIVLFTGTLRHVGMAALALATATLVVAAVRFALSLRGMSSLTQERHRLSLTDELTGVGNRRMLSHVFDNFFSELAEPEATPRRLAFLFLDLDKFKEVNDSFGHSAGDALLRQLGPRLRSALRNEDVVVRLGGDELGIVLFNTDVQSATQIAERMLMSLGLPFIVEGVGVTISASVGVAMAPADAYESEELLRCADVAMYRAKLARTGVAIYQAELDDEGNRLRLAEELRTAVEERSLSLNFQPQVDLQTGSVIAAEALLRWVHPRLGTVPPLHFLPLAEELGLMMPLTVLVMDMAFEQCAAWHAAGNHVGVSVNVSASNLLDDRFLDNVRSALDKYQLTPSACILEITETTIIEDFQACKRVIEQLRSMGIAVSIDDFGAGFTSLAYLGSLAVSEVKLDRSFITGLAAEGRERDRELVRATIDLGHALGLRVVAEGIEDHGSLDMLASMGCDVAQGYYMGRPAPAVEVTRMLGAAQALAS